MITFSNVSNHHGITDFVNTQFTNCSDISQINEVITYLNNSLFIQKFCTHKTPHSRRLLRASHSLGTIELAN